MNTQSNAMPESFGSQVIASPAMSPTRPLYWSVRRELWENRFVYIAPLSVAAVTLFGFLIATMGFVLSTTDVAQRRTALEHPLSFAAGVIMATTFVVGIFYSLEALHGERRDRSILFWKSLPVSDLTTVLSKASIPLIVLPLLTVVIVVATQLIMLLLGTLVLLGSGLSVNTLWTESFQMSLMLLYHMVTVHVLWHAPIYGWLLLVSGWARRAAFLWATLPPLAICAIEKLAFNSKHFAVMLLHRFTGGPEAVTMPGRFLTDAMTHLTPGRFLSSPGLWIGLVIAAGFLAAAVRLRRYQGPI
jgi:ABC-2 type transport system permease protein